MDERLVEAQSHRGQFIFVCEFFRTTLVEHGVVELSDGVRLRIGDELQLGGGFIEQDLATQGYRGSHAQLFLSAPLD